MPKAETPARNDERIAHLVAISQIDTLFYDHYFLRAQGLLQQQLPLAVYQRLLLQKKHLVSLPDQIRTALSAGNWQQVRDLSQKYETLSIEINRYAQMLELAGVIYGQHDLPIDPFSPGMNTIPGVSRKGFPELRAEGNQLLEQLARTDRELESFYRSRIQSFGNLAAEVGSGRGLGPSMRQLESQALAALDEGNYHKLAQLADNLRTVPDSTATALTAGSGGDPALPVAPGYDYAFSDATIRKARKLGLEWQHAPSRQLEFAPLCKFAWHPAFAQPREESPHLIQVADLALPQNIPEALKSRVQMFAMHPMINSGGVRFLPSLAAEDVLVETFAEPQQGGAAPGSGLLELLGLAQRNQLNRQQIETALLTHGSRILQQELDLDPFNFRLVCIPPDLHLRLGLERGWGQQQIWTHFDGYLVMMDGTLRPLAGGDVRYGGIYDLLGITRHYASERIIVRFAVVQRRRMAIG
jgi:hypothetical protein